jgi:hypothetical protein
MGIDSLANYYRSQLKAHGVQASAQVETAHAQAKQEIQPHLEQLYQEISTKQQEDTQPSLSWLYAGKKLEHIGQVVGKHIGKFAQGVQKTIDQLVQWAFSLGQQAGQAFLPGSSHSVSQPPTTTDSGLFGGFAAEAAKGVKDAFKRAISLGSKPDTLAREVDQALDVSRHRSLTILDTELFKAFNATVVALFQDGWIWHCQLNPRSCACCVALHGTFHRLGEQLYDHPNGSCIKIPYRSDMPAIQTGIEWFKQQSEGTQQAILGTRIAWELYQSGAGLQAFVGMHHDAKYGPSVYQKSAKELMKGE